MKVLHVVERWAAVGGVETYTMELVPLLESRGYDNVVATASAEDAALATDVHVVPVAGAGEMESLLRRHRPDVAYLHDVYDPAVAAAVARRLPAVGYVHIFYPVCPALGKLFRRGDRICERPFGVGCVPRIYLDRCASARRPANVVRIMRRTARHLAVLKSLPQVLVASRYMRDLLVGNGVDAARIERLPYFVPIPDAVEASPEAGAILFAGRIEHEKGLPYLLRACARMTTPFRLTVAGSGSQEESCRRLAASLGLESRVRFSGWQSPGALADAYRAASVVVMPTLMPEPFGKVGVEALAHARPVVAFDVGGIPDWLRDGENGVRVAPRDIVGLAAALDRLVEDPTQARALGAAGRRGVVGTYDSARHVDDLVRVIEGVAGRSAA